MRHLGLCVSLAIAGVLCVGAGTRAARAQQHTNIANVAGNAAVEATAEHQPYVFPGERAITHNSVERKLDYREIKIAQREETAAPADAEAESVRWWQRPFRWRLRKLPAEKLEPRTGTRVKAERPDSGHRPYEFPGERQITHQTAGRQLDYEHQGISGRHPSELDTAKPGASVPGTAGVDTWGETATTGKYRGRRTNFWRELALSEDPSAYGRLIAAVQYYPGHNPPNDIRTRREAAEALGVLRDPRAIQALEDALNDPDFMVRQQAARSLAVLRQYAP